MVSTHAQCISCNPKATLKKAFNGGHRQTCDSLKNINKTVEFNRSLPSWLLSESSYGLNIVVLHVTRCNMTWRDMTLTLLWKAKHTWPITISMETACVV